MGCGSSLPQKQSDRPQRQSPPQPPDSLRHSNDEDVNKKEAKEDDVLPRQCTTQSDDDSPAVAAADMQDVAKAHPQNADPAMTAPSSPQQGNEARTLLELKQAETRAWIDFCTVSGLLSAYTGQLEAATLHGGNRGPLAILLSSTSIRSSGSVHHRDPVAGGGGELDSSCSSSFESSPSVGTEGSSAVLYPHCADVSSFAKGWLEACRQRYALVGGSGGNGLENVKAFLRSAQENLHQCDLFSPKEELDDYPIPASPHEEDPGFSSGSSSTGLSSKTTTKVERVSCRARCGSSDAAGSLEHSIQELSTTTPSFHTPQSGKVGGPIVADVPWVTSLAGGGDTREDLSSLLPESPQTPAPLLPNFNTSSGFAADVQVLQLLPRGGSGSELGSCGGSSGVGGGATHQPGGGGGKNWRPAAADQCSSLIGRAGSEGSIKAMESLLCAAPTHRVMKAWAKRCVQGGFPEFTYNGYEISCLAFVSPQHLVSKLLVHRRKDDPVRFAYYNLQILLSLLEAVDLSQEPSTGTVESGSPSSSSGGACRAQMPEHDGVREAEEGAPTVDVRDTSNGSRSGNGGSDDHPEDAGVGGGGSDDSPLPRLCLLHPPVLQSSEEGDVNTLLLLCRPIWERFFSPSASTTTSCTD